jgi:peptidoglycan/LPS O-acetylase OafA/YrhL
MKKQVEFLHESISVRKWNPYRADIDGLRGVAVMAVT